jgi:uncharacterized protein
MRQITLTYPLAQAFDGFGPGYFRLGGQILRGPVLVTPWDAGPWGGLTDWEGPASLSEKIDVLWLGMGATIAHPPQAFRAALEAAGIGVDVMSSPTAARTYNVLLGEGRRIAAALLPLT